MDSFTLNDFTKHPNVLAQHYKEFDVENRYLFTGHSHQAWPDCAVIGQIQAWRDAAKHLDEKWSIALRNAQKVKECYSLLMDDVGGNIALASSTHDLLIRFLSGLNLNKRNRIITTDCEFDSARKQLDILSETKLIELIKVDAHPVEDVADKIIKKINDKTSAIIISSVYFNSGQIVQNIGDILNAAENYGAILLLDIYHMLNIVPFSIKEQKLMRAFVIGGGYKYCQLGEGNAFLRYPNECNMRPIITGWLSEANNFNNHNYHTVTSNNKKEIFSVATYEPTSHYRAISVFDFFNKNRLSVHLLRKISQHQVKLIINLFNNMKINYNIIDIDRSVAIEKIAGFIALKTKKAPEICNKLKNLGVYTDHRGDYLRIGPAPYLSDKQIVDAMKIFEEVVNNVR